MSQNLDVALAARMAEIDKQLKGNRFHTGWYDVHWAAVFLKCSDRKARYWLERGVTSGKFERRKANLGHGYYWWYEYKRI